MKYIFKLTIFMVLGLLLVSCSKSSSSSKHNTSIKLQGVLEKGKATNALCKVSTLDGKAYSKSNHIENGGYVASVPAGAFDVRCTINKYIDDKKGDEVKPAMPITLEAISFAKAGKNKTVNVNVITDLVAKELTKSKGKIKDEKSFNSAKEDAKNTALKGILSTQSTIEDIDTLHLDRSENNVLTKVSLAIQEQIDKHNPQITTVDQALTEAKNLHSIVTQNVNDLSLEAIATPPTNIQTPKPTGQTQKITLTGATIGGVGVTTKLTNIDASNSVVFSIPTKNLGDVADSDSVYITSDKAGQTIPKKLEGGKSAPYMASDVRDLFISDKVTTFTLCVVPTMKEPLKSEANAQCQSADRKVTFIATAAISSAGGATGGDKDGTPTVTTITLTGAMIGGKAVTLSPTGINSKVIAFSLPANDLVDVADSDSVYITSDKAGQTIPKKLEGGKTAPYTASDVRDLFIPDKVTTFTLCVVPTMATPLGAADNGKCQSASVKATFTATAVSTSSLGDFKSPSKIFVGGNNVLGDSYEIANNGLITFSMPKTLVTKLPSESVYITNSKNTIIKQLTLEGESYTYGDIKEFLLPVGQKITLYLCILTTTKTPDSESCRKSTTQKNLPVMISIAKHGIAPLTVDVMIGRTHLNTKGETLIDNTDKIAFSMPEALVTKFPSETVYIASNIQRQTTDNAIKLNLVDKHYVIDDIKALLNPGGAMLLLCIHSKATVAPASYCMITGGNAMTGNIKFKPQP